MTSKRRLEAELHVVEICVFEDFQSDFTFDYLLHVGEEEKCAVVF